MLADRLVPSETDGCRNGTLREYFVPEVEKGDFRSRIMAAVDDKPSRPVNQTPQSQNEAGANVTGGVSASAAAPAAVAEPAAPFPSPAQPGQDTRAQQPSKQQRDESIRAGKRRMERMEPKRDNAQRTIAASSEKARQPKVEQVKDTKDAEQVKVKDTQKQKAAPTAPGADSPASNTDSSQVRQKPTPTLPKQYRLQVRLFDGSTVRSSFSPSQTIRKDVRSWLDGQLPDETQPYNLKHILTPLPNRTLSVPEEDKTLEDLRLGPSANLVMVPVPSYSEAYASTSSPPVRAVSSVFNLAYSAASAVGEMTSSFLGYGQTASESTEGGPANTAPSSTNSDGAQRSHPAPTGGPIIRTLRDHREGRDDSQLYNGNQVCMEVLSMALLICC